MPLPSTTVEQTSGKVVAVARRTTTDIRRETDADDGTNERALPTTISFDSFVRGPSLNRRRKGRGTRFFVVVVVCSDAVGSSRFDPSLPFGEENTAATTGDADAAAAANRFASRYRRAIFVSPTSLRSTDAVVFRTKAGTGDGTNILPFATTVNVERTVATVVVVRAIDFVGNMLFARDDQAYSRAVDQKKNKTDRIFVRNVRRKATMDRPRSVHPHTLHSAYGNQHSLGQLLCGSTYRQSSLDRSIPSSVPS